MSKYNVKRIKKFVDTLLVSDYVQVEQMSENGKHFEDCLNIKTKDIPELIKQLQEKCQN